MKRVVEMGTGLFGMGEAEGLLRDVSRLSELTKMCSACRECLASCHSRKVHLCDELNWLEIKLTSLTLN